MTLDLVPRSRCRWDLVALGEVMLRLDPGEGRIASSRTFCVWEGGGEYNVARGLKRCFGLETTIVTALVDNPIGRLIQDLIYQGGVDQSHILWTPFDGVGRTRRNGLNFTERGFGLRAPLGCSDRGHTAVSQLTPGTVDWNRIFASEGARWLHCGGIFAGLSETTSLVAKEAMEAARRNGTIVSYDLNYRDSLWRDLGGPSKAHQVNRELVPLVDVLFGNEEDFTASLGFEGDGVGEAYTGIVTTSFGHMIERVAAEFPNLKVVATSLRDVKSATRNDWTGVLYAEGRLYASQGYRDLEVLDRVGGGDSFAAGVIFGLLNGYDLQRALEFGVAHGALAVTTPGDTSMATLTEVERVMNGGNARILR
jgi:2-dehydro-3-deoxygluconokinase